MPSIAFFRARKVGVVGCCTPLCDGGKSSLTGFSAVSDSCLWLLPHARRFRVSFLLAFVGFAAITRWLLHVDGHPWAWLHFFLCGVVGMATAYVFILSTQVHWFVCFREMRSRGGAAGKAGNSVCARSPEVPAAFQGLY